MASKEYSTVETLLLLQLEAHILLGNILKRQQLAEPSLPERASYKMSLAVSHAPQGTAEQQAGSTRILGCTAVVSNS